MTQIIIDHNKTIDDLPKIHDENAGSRIITMGEMIGMISMILGSIIEAIEKAGNVGKKYLETNLKMMRDTALHAKKSHNDKAQGMRMAAIIGITIAAAGIGAQFGTGARHVSNSKELQKIQSAPLAQPPKVGAANGGLGSIQGSAVGKASAAEKGKKVVDLGGAQAANGKPGMEAQLVPSKQKEVAGGEKVLHGKDKDATTYASEAEKERAVKIQQELNNKPTFISAAAGMVNPHVLQVGSIEQARKDDDASKAEYVSNTERANSDALKTLQGENGNFFGSLGGLVDRLAIANIVTQTLIASSQWR